MRIARAWQLPEHVVLGIEHHHDAQGRGLGPIVHRAREVASRLGIGDGLRSPTQPEPDENRLSWLEAWDLRLHGDDWAWRAVRATGGIRELAQRMGLDPQGPARAA